MKESFNNYYFYLIMWTWCISMYTCMCVCGYRHFSHYLSSFYNGRERVGKVRWKSESNSLPTLITKTRTRQLLNGEKRQQGSSNFLGEQHFQGLHVSLLDIKCRMLETRIKPWNQIFVMTMPTLLAIITFQWFRTMRAWSWVLYQVPIQTYDYTKQKARKEPQQGEAVQ